VSDLVPYTSVMEKNAAFLDRVPDGGTMDKEAAETVLSYTRKRVREIGIMRKIHSIFTPTQSMLSRRVDSELPVVVVDFEPDSPGGIALPVNGNPPTQYIASRKYEVRKRDYSTVVFQKNVDELKMYTYDVRQVVADNSIKDLMRIEDFEYMFTVDTLLGAEGSPVPSTGSVQNKVISGGIDRDTVPSALSIIPDVGTEIDYGLKTEVILVNSVTVYQLLKWGRDEVGGDMAERVYREGMSEFMVFGHRVAVTNKRTLVPNNVMYFFAPDRFRGKLYQFQEPVLRLKRERKTVSFSADEGIGWTLPNSAAFARARFAV
jgi:hypothetical protein